MQAMLHRRSSSVKRGDSSCRQGFGLPPGAGGRGHAGVHITQNRGHKSYHPENADMHEGASDGSGAWLQAGGTLASGAQDARLLFRGPWAAVRWGRSGRAVGEPMDGFAFSRGQATAWTPELRQRRSGCPSPLEKPGTASRTFRPWMDGTRQPGCRFLLATSP